LQDQLIVGMQLCQKSLVIAAFDSRELLFLPTEGE